MTDIPDAARETARRLADEMKADVYLLNGGINESNFGDLLMQVVVSKRQHKHCLLVLVTYGGSANSAYRIARLFLHHYEKFTVSVPSFCKSAGTLIVCGAHNLIMQDVLSELGPLDVQLYKSDELGEIRSGLILRSAFDSLQDQTMRMFEKFMLDIKKRSSGLVRFRTAAEISSDLVGKMLSPIYGHISPLSAGEDYRDLHVALEYGKRLARYGRNIGLEQIDSLVHDYPSHDFVIDNEEARTLFKSVDDPSGTLFELVVKLEDAALVPKAGDDCIVEYLSRPQETEPQSEQQPGTGIETTGEVAHEPTTGEAQQNEVQDAAGGQQAAG